MCWIILAARDGEPLDLVDTFDTHREASAAREELDRRDTRGVLYLLMPEDEGRKLLALERAKAEREGGKPVAGGFEEGEIL